MKKYKERKDSQKQFTIPKQVHNYCAVNFIEIFYVEWGALKGYK